MRNFKLIIQYDGNRYNGWQKQGNTRNTLQGILENILYKIFDTDIEIHGSGRTDAGTHAKGQVANFKCETDMSTSELKNIINKYVPKDISVIDCSEVDMRFHSRLNAKSKEYLYIIDNGEIHDPFMKNYAFRVEEKIDIGLMKKAAYYFIGEHDFRAFCSNKRYKKSTIRTIYSIDISENNGKINILFNGNGFLYNMVRIIVGTLIEISTYKKSIEDINNIFNTEKRLNAGFTAPASGLYLMNVFY